MFPAGTECFFRLINVKYLKQSCPFLSGDCQIISFHCLWDLSRTSAFMHIYPCQMLVTQELYKYSLLLSLALHSSGCGIPGFFSLLFWAGAVVHDPYSIIGCAVEFSPCYGAVSE